MQPGLLSVYCEAVGGDPNETAQVGAAMVLLVAAADLHDDIIDESNSRTGNQPFSEITAKTSLSLQAMLS